MSSWQKVRLGDVVSYKKGYAFKSSLYKPTGRYIVRVSNTTSNSINVSSCVCIDEIEAEKHKEYELISNDIIIMTVGSWPNNPNSIVGKVVSVPDNAHRSLLNQNAVRLRANNEVVNQAYLFYKLKDKVFSDYIVGTAQGSANQASITLSDIFLFEFDLPPLEEQERIAKILGSLDDKIELNNKINRNLEAQAEALFKQWFVDFDFPDPSGNPYRTSGGAMIDSPLGKIPEGWSIGTLENIASVASGKRPIQKVSSIDPENQIPIIGASGIMGYTNNVLTEDQILVIGRVGTLGVIQRLYGKIWASDNTLIIRSKHQGFVYHILKGIDYKGINRGSTQPLITQTDIKNSALTLPEKNILCKFEDTVCGIINGCRFINSENAKLAELRDTLLPKLMNNEI